jgi:hypothetical protein
MNKKVIVIALVAAIALFAFGKINNQDNAPTFKMIPTYSIINM